MVKRIQIYSDTIAIEEVKQIVNKNVLVCVQIIRKVNSRLDIDMENFVIIRVVVILEGKQLFAFTYLMVDVLADLAVIEEGISYPTLNEKDSNDGIIIQV